MMATAPASPRLRVPGKVVILGCGSVSRCVQPLLLRHLDMDFRHLTVIDIEDLGSAIPATLQAGARFERLQLTPANLARELARLAGPGDLVLNLTWNIDTGDIVTVCREIGALYIDTSVEVWDPYSGDAASPADRTLYARHMTMRERTRHWAGQGPTAIVDHGANPGLISHWTRRGLADLATELLKTGDQLPSPLSQDRARRIEDLLGAADWSRLACELGVKVIHCAERDTQISSRPKTVGEFVNTWSVPGFHEEALWAPAELGWGTHEGWLPPGALTHPSGPGNQICLSQLGADTWVRSWVPTYGTIHGMVVRHGEAFTISEALTVYDDTGQPTYRPSVYYAYVPADCAMASLHECRMNDYQLQDRYRVMTDDEIISGRDELGALLLGHDLTGWWTGSQLTIEESRALVPGQNATTLQVAASILGAISWIIANPNRGLCTPEDVDHEPVLQVADLYLGNCPSLQTSWTPLANLAAHPLADPKPGADPWQFKSFLVN